MLIGGVYFSGLLERMDENAYAVLDQRVQSRAGYLEDDMVRRWSNLSLTQEVLGELYEGLVQDGSVTPGELASDPAQYNAFLEQAAPELVSLMRTNSVTGAFVVLEHADVPAGTEREPAIAGLYLRDRDPPPTPAPATAICCWSARRWNWCAASASPWTATGSRCSCWRGHTARADALPDKTLQRGGGGPVPWLGKCGLLGAATTLSGDNIRLISYSVPLIAPDGTVYGFRVCGYPSGGLPAAVCCLTTSFQGITAALTSWACAARPTRKHPSGRRW